MTDKMAINPATLKWAREYNYFKIEECYQRFGQKQYDDWENGLDEPTYAELKKLSEFFHKPIVVFFFNDTKDLKGMESIFPILELSSFESAFPDIVTLEWGRSLQLNLVELSQLSLEELDPEDMDLEQLRQKERSLIEIDQEEMELGELSQGSRPAAIAKISGNGSDVLKTVTEFRALLKVSLAEQNNFPPPEEAFTRYRAALEAIGVTVFKNPFQSRLMAGYGLYDPFFPVIVVNDRLTYSRQIFTLFHVMYHLINKTNGIDFLIEPVLTNLDDKILENGAHEFAAAFLATQDDCLAGFKATTLRNAFKLAQELSKNRAISAETLLTKLLFNNLIDPEIYTEARAALYEANFSDIESDRDFPSAQLASKGRRYIELAYRAYYQRFITIHDLATYMNLNLADLIQLSNDFGWGPL
ncbi:MAG: ImmA/IrrE family metallo-endopeptidase [Deltaproteobacteria bacterium]|jgi:Zn-dependent peptidase ImmA (M78 family)|nr:ImmA/IrrE family metallo-endopeptidase [Deltaproteobacteria bacterium]